jgi:hypothetical protein
MNDVALATARAWTTDTFTDDELDYRVCHTPQDIASYLSTAPNHHFSSRILLAEDTESLPNDSPYCLTFSVLPGTGRLIYARDRSLLSWYIEWVRANEPHHLFHNYLHDVVPFDGWGIPIHKFTDTMVRAYNLCLGGGGDDDEDASGAARGLLSLKVLAWRHCQMRMTSFQDTVHPHSIPHALAWLKQGREMLAPMPVKTCECGHARERHLPRGKTGKAAGACTLCQCLKYKQYKKPKGVDDGSKELGLLHRKINGLVNQLENGEADINPWKRVADWHGFDRETLENALGPMPRPSIAHVPEPELLQYAVRDCDATLRLYLHMRRLKPWIFYNR